jgi:hypothetical protein
MVRLCNRRVRSQGTSSDPSRRNLESGKGPRHPKSRFLKYQHEQAYLLAKGNPTLSENPISDVIDMPYSGNKLHPTQKPVATLKPLIEAFTQKTIWFLIRSVIRAQRYSLQKSSTATTSASNSMLGIMRPLPGGCILMAFVRVKKFTRRRTHLRQGPCRPSAVRCNLQQSSSSRSAALTSALRRSLCCSSLECQLLARDIGKHNGPAPKPDHCCDRSF